MGKNPNTTSVQSKNQENLLILLEEAQSKFGYLSQELMAELAESLGISISDVYGTATFYSFLYTQPPGKYVIKVCKSLPCFLENSEMIIESLEQELGIRPGETTSDGKFSFQLTNCIGACDKAPAMMINNEVYTDLTPEKIKETLKACD